MKSALIWPDRLKQFALVTHAAVGEEDDLSYAVPRLRVPQVIVRAVQRLLGLIASASVRDRGAQMLSLSALYRAIAQRLDANG